MKEKTVSGLVALVLPGFLLFFAPLLEATQSDAGKEQRWAMQVVDGLLDGEAIWLDDGGGHAFLGILTEGENREQAVVLAHGIGVHPNWPDVIYPLREGLLEAGITSLSIQLPILANEAEASDYAPLFAEAPARFRAAVTHLRELGYRSISIVAHSMGASMAAHASSAADAPGVASVVLIGMGPGIDGQANIEALGDIGVPVFDLYGGEDLPQVLESAEFRAESGRSRGDREYRQVVVDGANHFFQGNEDDLVAQTLAWLRRF